MTRPLIGQLPPPGLVELAASARRLNRALMRIEHDHPELGLARDTLDGLSEELEALGSEFDAPRAMPGADPATTRPYYFPANLEPRVHPAAPWMTATQEADRRYGQVRFDLIHEGPPGYVHGGFVAWMFDQVFGQHVVEGELVGGPTHRLEVTYRKPTPILRELAYEVRTDRVDGRKAFMTATLHDGEVLTAEAMAIFVMPKGAPLAFG